MSISKIEQLIDDIIDFVENSKTSFTNPNKVTIYKQDLYDILDELRLRTPEEIKKCQKIINNRNNILEDAKQKAEVIIEQANSRAAAIIDDSEMVHQANAKAQEIVEEALAQANKMIGQANSEAEQIRISAISYTNELLTNAESIIQNAYKNTKARYDLVFSALKEDLDIIAANKRELEADLPREVIDNNSQVPDSDAAVAIDDVFADDVQDATDDYDGSDELDGLAD